MKLKYYIIHNLDPKRKTKMVRLLTGAGVDMNDVTWILHPNKDEIDADLKNLAVQQNISLKNGYICCTYKHYLAIKDIVENKHEYSVVIEDNIGHIFEDIDIRFEKYREQLPEDWDIIFDTNWASYKDIHEDPVTSDKLVYKKKNEVTKYCHGGSRVAQFYILTLTCAEKMYPIYLPFNNAPDLWMNELFRKSNVESYWAEPTNILSEENHVSST